MDFLSLVPLLKDVIGLFPSEQKRIELTTKLQEFELEVAKGQLEVNKAEASNDHWFVAGWRPFIGWCCGFGLVYSWVALPFGYPIPDMNVLMTLLGGMLGLGGLRTFEKVKK